MTADMARRSVVRHSSASGGRAKPPSTLVVSAPTHVTSGGDSWLTAVLLVVAGAAWLVTIRASADTAPMGVALVPFLTGWAAMMAAMMLPAVTPVVLLYARAARAGKVAPAGFFVSGYLAVWVLTGLPTAVAWSFVHQPLMAGATWTLRLAAVTLLVAGAYQLTPLKRACLRHCRSPMGVFLRGGRPLHQPINAFRAGMTHGLYCLGCCVGLMLVLVLAATMQPLWAALVAAVVFAERNLRVGESLSVLASAALLILGGATLIQPALAAGLVQGVMT